MSDKVTYDFGEKKEEWSSKQGKNIPVWQSPKFEQSRKKAIEVIEAYEDIEPSDFWILMNETKSGKMAYTGLIISHNACLKINDHMPPEKRFRPSCLTKDKEGYGDSLVYEYSNDEQGLYEVGEVSKGNCKNAYPHAMAYKRCYDRVVLKLCKLAYSGVYSDSEADEFKESPDEEKAEKMKKAKKAAKDMKMGKDPLEELEITELMGMCAEHGINPTFIASAYKVESLEELTYAQYLAITGNWEKILDSYKRSVEGEDKGQTA